MFNSNFGKGFTLDLNCINFENMIQSIMLDSKSTLEREGREGGKEKEEGRRGKTLVHLRND
jgi:hypothetical protein